MVGRASHGADTVGSIGQTTSDGGLELSLAVAGIVDTLEEGKGGSIQWRGGVQVVLHILDGDVGVADDRASGAQLLGRRVVRACRVGEGAQVHVGDLHHHVEVRLRSRLLANLGADDDRGRHLGRRWYVAHGDTIAGSSLLLDTVGQKLAFAEVDEVVVVGERILLALAGVLGAILLRAGLQGLCCERAGSSFGISVVVGSGFSSSGACYTRLALFVSPRSIMRMCWSNALALAAAEPFAAFALACPLFCPLFFAPKPGKPCLASNSLRVLNLLRSAEPSTATLMPTRAKISVLICMMR